MPGEAGQGTVTGCVDNAAPTEYLPGSAVARLKACLLEGCPSG